MFKVLSVFLFFSLSIKAQIIQGTVSTNSEAVPFVSVLLKKTSSPDLIYQFTTTNEKGFYEINLKSPLDSLIIEISTVSYEPQLIKIGNLQQKTKHNFDFDLNVRVTELKEVIIESKQPIKVKNDTVTYDPNAFKDGTERVIEDLIKKLPGMKVEENGEIKFKGKSIKKFLLDGDDLFDANYKIGSKNISVEMVDKVQALENFNENPLLKGLVDSEDVAINLVLKKGKTDFSGNAQIAYGIEDKYDINATNLVVNKKLKGFAIASYNNVGNNNSPYDFDSGILSLEQMRDDKYLTPQLLSQGNFYSQLDDKFHRINRNLYASINALYKINSKTTSKINLGIYDDRLKRTNSSFSKFTINNEDLQISELENIVKKPRLYNANLQLLHKASDSLTIEYLGKINYEEIDYKSKSINNQVSQENAVNTTNFFTKQNLNLTKRIDERSALTATALYSKNRAPQNYILSPGLLIEDVDAQIIGNNQFSKFDKQTFKLAAEYFIKKENSKLQFATGFNSVNNTFRSALSSISDNGQEMLSSDFQNNLDYNFQMPFFGAGFSYAKNNFQFASSLVSQYYFFDLTDEIRTTEHQENNFILAPNLKFQYKFNKKASILATYSYNEISPNEKNIFNGIVLTGYRNFENNDVDLRFLKTNSYVLSYNYYNFYELTSFSISLNHNNRENNYFSRNQINPNTTISTSFLLDTGNKDYSLSINGEKYVHFLRTTFQANTNYFISQSQNIVNNSGLRSVESRSLFLNLTGRTGFKGNLNFENKISFTNNRFLLDGTSQNNFSSLKNSFKAIFKVKENLKANAVLSFISSDLSVNNNYWFLDTELRFTSKNKKFDYTIIGRNLTNNTTFETVSISDYSRSTSSHNLINRFVLASIGFNF